jgi:hypothetical protein
MHDMLVQPALLAADGRPGNSSWFVCTLQDTLLALLDLQQGYLETVSAAAAAAVHSSSPAM